MCIGFKVIYTVQVNIQVKTDIKLDDCDKHVWTDCKNDHSTSKVLGHVTGQSNLISTSVGVDKLLALSL